jgi:hypothetical protein
MIAMGGSHASGHVEVADEAFDKAFSATDRAELMQEDHEAWEGVTGLLLTIVTIGVLFFAVIVCVITF